MDILSNLNQAQKEAVLHTEGPLLIVAGAGAGKTKTITHRICHLIEKGINPENILAVTFTNKAAKEMRERTRDLLSQTLTTKSPHFYTFHSLGVFILRENAELLGLTRSFTIADDEESKKLIKEALKIEGLDPKMYEPKKILSIISREKGEARNQSDYAQNVASGYGEMVASIWATYEKLLTKNQMLDFDDLLYKTYELLERFPETKSMYQKRYQYIHIDEYQDTNELQYRISKLLVGPEENICVVGDSDQNIYSWRGANIKNILNFERDYPKAKVVMLEENYRSTKNILEAANEVIRKNELRKDKKLFTSKNAGEKIVVCECYDENREAEFITSEVDKLLLDGVKKEDIAILFRANFQSRVIEDAFLKAQIPYSMLGTKFFERKEIKDILSYIKYAKNRNSLSDLKRIVNTPTRGIGEKTVEKIIDNKIDELSSSMREKVFLFFKMLDEIYEATTRNKPSEVIRFVLTRSGMEEALSLGDEEDKERLENAKELVTVALSYDEIENGLEKLIDDAMLASDQDSLVKDGGGVRLMTIHASKGLEFDYVFITGLEQDLFPHKRSDERHGKDEREEERRLMYVAITRAKKKLFLSYATIRTIYGSREIHAPSEFLSDIPDDLIIETWKLDTRRENTMERHEGGGITIYLD